MENKKFKKRLSSFRIILFGFAALILFGCAVLMLPISTADGLGAAFGDALFTATSAVCVTGLVVRDTATYWSSFGHAVIILLIQIGGMGVVTIAVSFVSLSGKKIGLRQRSILQDSLSAPQLGGIVTLMKFIVKAALLIEAFGAVMLYPVFFRMFGPLKAIWYAVFHSISAFCNAGFDIMGALKPSSSLTLLSGEPIVNIIIPLLILAGGIGFLTWDDICRHKLKFRKYRMQSKVMLVMTAVLLVLPFLFFFFFEFTRPCWGDLSAGERIWLSLFQTVTPRTAGFNTADLSLLSDSAIAVMIFLMLLGGCSGSTAGGMKVTTFAVLFASAAAVFKRNEEASLFRRRIPQETVRSAAAIAFLYLMLLFASGTVISCIEGLPLNVCLFETASAICTVGLTTGITASLGGVSHGILIALMFLGRVGGLTLVYAALAPTFNTASHYPRERINVG